MSELHTAMRNAGWRRQEQKAFTCQCCGKLVTLGWASGHYQMCDECRPHWRTGYFCDGPAYAKTLSRNGTYVKATE